MKKILLVEDDNNLANTIKDFFSPLLYQIIHESDGLKGYKLAINNKYDLILLDLILPSKSGFLISKDLRNNNNDTPIIAITSKYDTSTRITCWQMGVDQILGKPFSTIELKNVTEAILKRPPSKHDDNIVIGEIEYDCNLNSIKRNGKIINLRKKEIEILLFLMKNRGKVISKSKIYDYIYDIESNTLEAVIDVHISNIRKKINRGYNSKLKLINTIHSRGYIIY